MEKCSDLLESARVEEKSALIHVRSARVEWKRAPVQAKSARVEEKSALIHVRSARVEEKRAPIHMSEPLRFT